MLFEGSAGALGMGKGSIVALQKLGLWGRPPGSTNLAIMRCQSLMIQISSLAGASWLISVLFLFRRLFAARLDDDQWMTI